MAPEPSPGRSLLGRLLEASRERAPDELTALASEVAAALDLHDVRLYLVDYSLRWLVPLAHPADPTDPEVTDRLEIDSSMGGRAFARGAITRDSDDPGLRWVPLIDSGNRIGAMQVRGDPSAIAEQATDEAAADLAAMMAELIVAKSQFTDLYRSWRRVRPLTVAAEMQWDLLPPLTYSTSRFTIAGVLEPAYDIGGDSFDYAHNGATCELTIIDAVGHGTEAMVLAAVATAGLRNARRGGASLEATYLAAGALIEEQIGGSAFVTGQLARLDVEVGRLHWISAGHPPPLLLRDGAVQELAARPSLPMGLGGHVVEQPHVDLQPGDRLLFYSDGVVEPHQVGSPAFGTERLADFMVRSALDGLAPAETLRRLAQTVLADADDRLRDDATMLLVEFHGRDSPPDLPE